MIPGWDLIWVRQYSFNSLYCMRQAGDPNSPYPYREPSAVFGNDLVQRGLFTAQLFVPQGTTMPGA